MTENENQTGREKGERIATLIKYGGSSLVILLLIVQLLPVGKRIVSDWFKPEDEKALARDEERLHDIRLIQAAIEEYKIKKGFYPVSIQRAPYISLSTTDGDLWIESMEISFLPFDRESGKQLDSLPKDPLNKSDFFYSYKTSKPPASDYELDIRLEKDVDNLAKDDTGNNEKLYELGTDLTLIN